jgi:hypothetical protein
MPALECSLSGFGTQSKPFLHMVFLVVSAKVRFRMCVNYQGVLRDLIMEWE